MDNPCKYCEKANIHYVNNCEYGCDEPCQKAENFYKSLDDKFEALLDKLTKLLEMTEANK